MFILYSLLGKFYNYYFSLSAEVLKQSIIDVLDIHSINNLRTWITYLGRDEDEEPSKVRRLSKYESLFLIRLSWTQISNTQECFVSLIDVDALNYFILPHNTTTSSYLKPQLTP